MSEAQVTWADLEAPGKKRGVRCPKCHSTRIETVESKKEFKVFACPGCGFVWEELVVPKLPSKVRCVLLMGVSCLAYLAGLELLVRVNWSVNWSAPDFVLILVVLSVISVPHTVLHALARRFLGYRAYPIPILFPPILGFAVGERLRTGWESLLAALAPALLTVANWLFYWLTGDERHLFLGLLNLFCIVFDVVPAVRAAYHGGVPVP